MSYLKQLHDQGKLGGKARMRIYSNTGKLVADVPLKQK
jgi:hypothetical protein